MSEPAAADILLVEDNPTDLDLALHAFKKHGLRQRVAVARDGAEALAMFFGDGAGPGQFSQRSPRVILLDLQLPKVSGLEVLQRLKSEPQTRAIPVVVLTSSRENSDLEAAYRFGANSYIVKPVDFAQFSKCVREIGLYWLDANISPGNRGDAAMSALPRPAGRASDPDAGG